MIRGFHFGFFCISLCWNGDIHREIVLRAYENTSKSGRRYIREHLGTDTESIQRAGVWADTPQALHLYPESDQLHFSHTPYRKCRGFDIERDCGRNGSGRCLVTGIADMVMSAVNSSLPSGKRAEALKFVLHLVADIHQPLHTGFRKDAGGNNITLSANPITTLHQLWDSGLDEPSTTLNPMAQDPMPGLTQNITSREVILNYASSLATESTTLYTCNYAYKDENGSYIREGSLISPDYLSSRRTIAQNRIQLAIKRLAELIDRMAVTYTENRGSVIFPEQTPVPITSRPDSPTDTTNIFTVLDMEFEPDEIADACEVWIESLSTSSVPRQSRRPKRHVVDDDESFELLAAPVEPIMVGQVNVEDVVLIKRFETYYLTCVELVTPTYYPLFGETYRVRFAKRVKDHVIRFTVDDDCFGSPPLKMTKSDFAKIMVSLKGGDPRDIEGLVLDSSAINAVSRIDPRMWSNSMIYGRRVDSKNVLPVARPVLDDPYSAKIFNDYRAYWDGVCEEISSGKHKSLDDKSDHDFYTKLNSVVEYMTGNTVGLFHIDTVLDRSKTHRRFNVFDGHNPMVHHTDPLNRFHFVIDTALFDGMITRRISAALHSVIKKRIDNSIGIMSRNRRFTDEIKELNLLLHRSTANPPPQRLKIIRDLVQYRSRTTPVFYTVVEYDI